MRCYITGAMGFIGSHVADLLEVEGHEVRGCDRLVPQVHPSERPPIYAIPNCPPINVLNLIGDDVAGCDALIHLAARVGVGQSSDEPFTYTHENVCGTANVMEAARDAGIKRVVVASSMSVYGDGIATQGVTEDHPCEPQNVYATTKLASELVALQLGRAYNIPTLALRFFNVYGRRQTLSNPYTGLGAIFSQQILDGERPQVFEDGLQLRDFVHVSDVARACLLALKSDESDYAMNIGSGIPTSVLTFAQNLCEAHGTDLRPEITGHKREGDVRYIFANIELAQEMLGYVPLVPLTLGLTDLVEWTAQTA